MRAKKIDTTHNPIADHLQSIGYSVSSTAGVGGGFPDLVVADGWFTALVEAKTGTRKLRPGQEAFRKSWKGIRITANSPQQAEAQLAFEKTKAIGLILSEALSGTNEGAPKNP